MALDAENIFPTAREGADEFFIQEAEEALRPRIVVKLADQINPSSILTDATDLFMNLSADKIYEFEVFGNIKTSDTEFTGIKVSFSIPTGAIGKYYIPVAAGEDFSIAGVEVMELKDIEGNAFAPTLSLPSLMIIKGWIKTKNNAGKIQLRFASGLGAALATIKEGAYLKVTRQ